MSVEVMKQALEALENHAPIVAGREIEALRAAIQQAESGHARLPGALKDHQIAAMVNSLRDIARQFHGHGSLRERIANVLVPALKAEAKTDEPVAWVFKAPGGYHTIGYDSRVLNGVPHGTKLFAHPPQQ